MNENNHSRLRGWWEDNPDDPDRMSLNDPDVQKLIDKISPDSRATDLGGTMSLNVRLQPNDLVLRVHQPFVSRRRLLAIQEIRSNCLMKGLIVPVPVTWKNKLLLRCRNRWAELERFIESKRLDHTVDSYVWLFNAMGKLHNLVMTPYKKNFTCAISWWQTG